MAWDDDHLLFTDLASPGTMANLESNPAIELNVVDVFLRKGYRFKGVATIHRDSEVFGAVVERMRNGAPSLRGLAERVRAVALVRVETASTLVSPGYWAEPPNRRCAGSGNRIGREWPILFAPERRGTLTPWASGHEKARGLPGPSEHRRRMR